MAWSTFNYCDVTGRELKQFFFPFVDIRINFLLETIKARDKIVILKPERAVLDVIAHGVS